MERAEGAQARVDELSLQIGEVQQEHAKVSAALEVAVTVIRADRADLDSQRAGLAARVPTDLLALYDKLRDSLGGVGAAPLRGVGAKAATCSCRPPISRRSSRQKPMKLCDARSVVAF